MNHYNPDITPISAEWLSKDEDERIELVMNYHEQFDNSLSDIQAHSVIHVIVENQLALNTDGIEQALKKLTREGLDRHEAVHAIGAVLAEDTFKLIKGEDEAWDHKGYRARLKKLTAARWLKGQY